MVSMRLWVQRAFILGKPSLRLWSKPFSTSSRRQNDVVWHIGRASFRRWIYYSCQAITTVCFYFEKDNSEFIETARFRRPHNVRKKKRRRLAPQKRVLSTLNLWFIKSFGESAFPYWERLLRGYGRNPSSQRERHIGEKVLLKLNSWFILSYGVSSRSSCGRHHGGYNERPLLYVFASS